MSVSKSTRVLSTCGADVQMREEPSASVCVASVDTHSQFDRAHEEPHRQTTRRRQICFLNLRAHLRPHTPE